MKNGFLLKPFSIFIVALAAFAGVIPAANAQITNTPNGYLFRMKFIKGTSMKYNIRTRTLAAKGEVGPNVLEVPTVMNITEVVGKVGTLKMEIGPPLQGGKPKGIKKYQELKMDDHGKVVSGLTPGLQSFKSVEYPDQPIKIGGTFIVSQDASFQGQKMQVKSVCTLKKVANLDGRSVAFIGMETQSSRIELPLSTSGTAIVYAKGTGDLQLDTADGQIILMVMKQRAIFKPGPGAPKDSKDEELTNVLTATRKF